MSEATRKALAAISRDAKAARVARALPKDKRPHGFMISIGMVPEDDPGATMIEAVPDDEDDDEA